MLLSKFAKVKWGYNGDKHYISKGYMHTKRGDIFMAKVEDLPLNSTALVTVKCDCCGQEKDITYSAYNICIKHCGKYYCRECSYKNPKTRIKFDEIVKMFNDKGYILLLRENEYKNSNQKLKYICPKHKDKGILTTTVKLMKAGSGCNYCGIESQKRKMTNHTLKEAQRIFNDHNYILLENTFISGNTKMKCKCKNHPDIIQYKRLSSLINNKGCYYCDLERRSQRFSGEGSLTWRGGITPLRRHLRYKTNKWIKDSLQYYGNKCFITGETENLEVHHMYSFDMILDKVIKQTDIKFKRTIGEYTKEELKILKKSFNEEHNKNYGIPLKKELHEMFHKQYGFGHNTPKQFYDFVSKYYKLNKPIQLALII